MTTRRQVLVGLAALIAAGLRGFTEAQAGPRSRRVRRRVRRRIRRRFRRRAVWRVIGGRRWLVVAPGLVVGWELALPDRVVVVKEIQTTQIEGADAEVAVVQNPDGSSEKIEIVREDNADTREALEGSVLPPGDTSTPSVESEEEMEEEVE